MTRNSKLILVLAWAMTAPIAFSESHDGDPSEYTSATAAKEGDQEVSIAVYNATGTCSYELVKDGEIVTRKGTFALQKYFCGPSSKQTCDDHKGDKVARFAESEEKCKAFAKSLNATLKQTALDTEGSTCYITKAKYCPKND